MSQPQGKSPRLRGQKAARPTPAPLPDLVDRLLYPYLEPTPGVNALGRHATLLLALSLPGNPIVFGTEMALHAIIAAGQEPDDESNSAHWLTEWLTTTSYKQIMDRILIEAKSVSPKSLNTIAETSIVLSDALKWRLRRAVDIAVETCQHIGPLAASTVSLLSKFLALVDSTSAFVKKFAGNQQEKMKTVLTAEADLRAKIAEVDARRTAVKRANEALARYIDPKAVANPPRLLRYMLEDTPPFRWR